MSGAPPPSRAERGFLTKSFRVLVLIGGLVCLTVGVLSRYALNPDGVAYFDLVAALGRGDIAHFIQGYWSPLFPVLISGLAAIFHPGIDGLILLTHLANVGAVLAALAIVYHWGARETAAHEGAGFTFAVAAVAVVLLCSAGPPRVESVTPDVLLLALAVALSYQLIARHGERWIVTGLLLGGMYLTKTSAWPWLLVGLPMRLWGAPDANARRGVWRSSAVALAVMGVWIIPLSLRYGRPTLGSSGRLNYSWYIAANSSRLPDADRGNHDGYVAAPLGNGQQVDVAHFDASDSWTYQPWSDPTAWQEGVLSETGRMPSAVEITGYWLRLFGYTFILWLGPLLLTVIAPLVWLQYRLRRQPSPSRRSSRDAEVVALLGVIGLLQFVAVHTEPRLIAPFGAMLGIGAAAWCCGRIDTERWTQLRFPWAWCAVGAVAAVGFSGAKIAKGMREFPQIQSTVAELRDMRDQLHASGTLTAEIAVIGPVAPVMQDLYWVGAHVGAQLLPRSIDALRSAPPNAQRALLIRLFGGRYSAVWQTDPDGGIRVLVVPPQ
ncbi:MAG TPA: hypothetical protein VGM77_05760 [Gemmatimonadales bacterium]|jgi:hypothetical protein